MDLTEAGTVRGMWRPPGEILLDHSTSGPCFHMSLSAILRSQDGTYMEKYRPVNFPKSQCHGFQLTEREMAVDEKKEAIASVMVLMGCPK